MHFDAHLREMRDKQTNQFPREKKKEEKKREQINRQHGIRNKKHLHLESHKQY